MCSSLVIFTASSCMMKLDDFNWKRQRVSTTMTFSHLHNTWMLLLLLGNEKNKAKKKGKKNGKIK